MWMDSFWNDNKQENKLPKRNLKWMPNLNRPFKIVFVMTIENNSWHNFKISGKNSPEGFIKKIDKVLENKMSSTTLTNQL